MRKYRPYGKWLMLVVLGIVMALTACQNQERRDTAPNPTVFQAPQSPLAIWPWPHATQESLHSGVMHWQDASSPDGTVLDLLEFDFAANPRLRLELFDQDADDEKPFDNRAKFWERGVGQITHQLNADGQGTIIAAWNGLFFSFDHQGADGIAEHVSPVVLKGKVL